ncbi:MAG: hypothetical protein ACI93R_002239 [Flavobacteriales bacterium]|jgi:hypothetical protein
MSPKSPFNDENIPRYLDALNDVLIKHPSYKLGMRFCDISLHDKQVCFWVKPCEILTLEDARKAFNDVASILTLSGDTIGFVLKEAQ